MGQLYYQGQNGVKTVPWSPLEEELSRLVHQRWRNPRSLSLLKPPPGAVLGRTFSLGMQTHLRAVPATSVVSQIELPSGGLRSVAPRDRALVWVPAPSFSELTFNI